MEKQQGSPKSVGEPSVKIDNTVSTKTTFPEEGDSMKKTNVLVIVVYIVLVVLGIGTGYLLSRTVKASTEVSEQPKFIKTDKVIGINDTKTFKDWADGVIEKEGIGGEGTHKLIREGGPSKTACLVSSVLDLNEYIGKKVKVWGETQAAKRCGWLMDVGKIELL